MTMTSPNPARDEAVLFARYEPEWGRMMLCNRDQFGAVEYRLASAPAPAGGVDAMRDRLMSRWNLTSERAQQVAMDLVSLSPTATSGSEAGGELNWRSIDNAPEDEWLLVATTGGWVGEATVIDGEWKWASGHVFHSDIVPQKWMPLPRHPDVATEAVACLTPAEQKQQAERCSCHGADDYCPCQNTPDATTIRNRKGA